jgi:hypothetical protein
VGPHRLLETKGKKVHAAVDRPLLAFPDIGSGEMGFSGFLDCGGTGNE